MQFSFHDSEVGALTPQGQALAIAFSAAAVQLPDGRSGYAQALQMRLEDAVWHGVLADCVGRLSDGQLWELQPTGTRLGGLALPYASPGPVWLALRFSNGAQLEINASALTCRPEDGAQFIESFAC